MAPQGFNIIGNKHAATSDDLFSLTLPQKKKKSKKGKKTSSPNKLISHYAPVVNIISDDDDDVVVIEPDDHSLRINVSDDDEVCVVNSPASTVVIVESEEDEPVSKRSRLDIEIPVTSNDTHGDNIVINIHQTLNVDHIMKGETIATRSDTFTSKTLVTNDVNVQLYPHLRTYGYPKTWTKEMLKYYTDPCEKSRNFDYYKILKKLKTKPSDWWINKADALIPTKRKSAERCPKCNRPGHTRQNCPRKIVCYLCGMHNHVHSDCPNTFCLTCGKSAKKNLKSCNYCEAFLTNKKPCRLCGQLYHSDVFCPSKWRKYVVVNSDQPVKLNPRKFCYNCAEVGHFGFECNLTPASEYPPENPLKSTFFDEHMYEDSNNMNADASNMFPGDQNVYPCNQNISTSNQNIFPINPDLENNEKRVIFVSKKNSEILATEDGSRFLKNFAIISNVRLEFFQGPKDYVRIVGTDNGKHDFYEEFKKWKLVSAKDGRM